MSYPAGLWQRHRHRIAVLLLLLVPGLFSVNQLTARGAADFFPPFALAFWRWSGACLVMLCFTGPRLWRQRQTLAAEWRDLLLLGFLGMFVCGAVTYIGGQTTTATNIGLITSASAVLIILIAWIGYGESLSVTQCAGTALALLGVLVIVCRGDPAVLAALTFTPGDLWMVGSATSWALYSVLLAKRPSKLDMPARFTAIAGAGALTLAPFAIGEAAFGHVAPFDLRSVGIVAMLVLIPSLAAYQGYAVVQRALGAGVAGLVAYLSPVYNAGLAWLFLSEVPERHHLMGAALVLPGLYLASRRPAAVSR